MCKDVNFTKSLPSETQKAEKRNGGGVKAESSFVGITGQNPPKAEKRNILLLDTVVFGRGKLVVDELDIFTL